MLRLSLAAALFTILAAAPSFAGHDAFPSVEPSDNVNSRYTVERVDLTGYQSRNVSRSIRQRLNSMIGRNLDAAALDRIAHRIREELRVEDVHIRIGKGTQPQHVAVQLEIEHRDRAVEFNLTRLGYMSNEGFSGAVGMAAEFSGNRASISYLSDSDQFVERATGLEGGFERTHFTRESRLGMRLNYGALSSTWDPQTAAAFNSDPTAVRYGFRQYIEPELIVEITPELEFTVGASVDNLQNIENPGSPRSLAANAITSGLRYRSRFEGSDELTQNIEAVYSTRIATRAMGSDFVYSRHTANVTYALRHLSQTLRFRWIAGLINGAAPMYERFALGNSNTLRGWNKYALAPLGGDRIVHGSVEYRYRLIEAFYDVGAIWDHDQPQSAGSKPVARQSVGIGIHKDAMQLAIAFPLRNGRIDPVFLAGVNF